MSTRCDATCGTCGRGIPTGPVLLRRHNTEYVTERCSLANPIEVVVGGTGYLTQQIHCLYGKVRDCTTSNARHLNDFTGSAYCMVENCHGDGDFHGATSPTASSSTTLPMWAIPACSASPTAVPPGAAVQSASQWCGTRAFLGHRLRKGQRSYPAGRRRLPHRRLRRCEYGGLRSPAARFC